MIAINNSFEKRRQKTCELILLKLKIKFIKYTIEKDSIKTLGNKLFMLYYLIYRVNSKSINGNRIDG